MIFRESRLLRRGGRVKAVVEKGRRARMKAAVESLEGRQLMANGLIVGAPVNVSQEPGNQSEPTIAVNPTNPQNIVVFSNDNGSLTDVFYGVSFDGGKTFTHQFVATGSDGLTKACCDVSAAFDQFGNMFLTYLDSGITTAPVVISTDGGKTLKPLFTVPNVADQPKLVVGPGGTAGAGSLWIEYLDKGGLIGAVGAAVTGLGQVGAASTPELVAGSGGGNFGKPAIGPSGQVMFSYEVPSGGAGPAVLYTALDPDGLGPNGFNAPVKFADTNVGGFAPIPPQPNRTVDSEIGLAYDYSGGPHNGRLYAIYTNSPAVNSPQTDIFERYSDDDGKTWTADIRITDDSTLRSKFFPRIAVDEYSGNVGAAWYDTRNDSGSGPGDLDGKPGDDSEDFASVSVDGGKTWLPNVQVASGPSNATIAGGDANSGNEYGDYSGLTFAKNVMYPVWIDNSTTLGGNPDRPNLDVATAEITIQTLSVQPQAITATEQTPFNGVVATFKPGTTGTPASSFTATINWGDGIVTPGVVCADVRGLHGLGAAYLSDRRDVSRRRHGHAARRLGRQRDDDGHRRRPADHGERDDDRPEGRGQLRREPEHLLSRQVHGHLAGPPSRLVLLRLDQLQRRDQRGGDDHAQPGRRVLRDRRLGPHLRGRHVSGHRHDHQARLRGHGRDHGRRRGFAAELDGPGRHARRGRPVHWGPGHLHRRRPQAATDHQLLRHHRLGRRHGHQRDHRREQLRARIHRQRVPPV